MITVTAVVFDDIIVSDRLSDDERTYLGKDRGGVLYVALPRLGRRHFQHGSGVVTGAQHGVRVAAPDVSTHLKTRLRRQER
jgi:hypothetical protein